VKNSWLRKLTFGSERVLGILGVVLIGLYTILVEQVRELVDFWACKLTAPKRLTAISR
jgi:hypothetical protein